METLDEDARVGYSASYLVNASLDGEKKQVVPTPNEVGAGMSLWEYPWQP